MRGSLSRAAFARELGVTALTVYRWELPEQAPEARRPRGRAIQALQAFARREPGQPARPLPPPPPPPAVQLEEEVDPVRLWPVLARVLRGEFRAAEEELLALLASEALRSPGARALAAVGLACVQRWGRDDLGAAFAALAPFLAKAEAGLLPPDVATWVHTLAAVVFAGFDGRLFDPGKVNAHVARAERLLPAAGQGEVRAILRWAEVMSALNLGEPELIRRSMERARDGLYDASEPLLRCLAGDIRANEAMVSGQGSQATRRFGEAAREAAGLGVAFVETRMHGFLAARRLEEAAHPQEALALCTQAREAARRGGLITGYSSVFLARVEAEALVRLARFEDARAALDAGERALQVLRWPAFQLQPTRARLCAYTGSGAEARAAGERLLAFDLPLMRGLNLAYAEFILAAADWMDGEAARAAQRFDAALGRAQEAGGWMFLQRECLVNAVGARVAAGQHEEAEDTLRAAERVVERLPSAWWMALLRRHKGMLRCAQGRMAEGRQHLEAALGTFVLACDAPEAALTRRALALCAEALGEPHAAAELARTEQALRGAGMALPAHLAAGTLPRAQPRSAAPAAPASAGLSVDGLVVPLQRLSVRGVGPGLLQRELVSVVREHLPRRAVRLEEVDSSGAARVVVPSAGVERQPAETLEFGDGMGRRLRLCVEGPLCSEERGLLSALTSFAALSLEVAALRGFSEPVSRQRAEEEPPELPGFVAASPALKQLKAELARLSGSRSTVIVTGESGVGKEVVARAIHQLSARRSRPYVAFNCASVPRELFEGQLFGYRRGAFTGASSDQPGVIRAANGGTLFLDEIGELPLEVQPKLLRFLENGEVFPLGETRPQQVDVRVLVATHRDLAQLVREGRFREDLFYRLQVVPIRVPALRERPEDITPLARHFITQLTPSGREPPTLSPDALAALGAWPWPGNVRELRNVLERALAFAPTPAVLTAEHLRLMR